MMYRCLSPLTPKILVFSLIVFFNVFEKKLIMLYFENLGTTYNPSISNGLKEHYLGTYFIIKLSFDLMIIFVLHNNQQQ